MQRIPKENKQNILKKNTHPKPQNTHKVLASE